MKAEARASGARADRVVVIKSARKLMLLRAGNVLGMFPVALGAHPIGPKREQGDGRTPEGCYRIDGFNSHSRFYRALHISYPNVEDVRRARAAGVAPGGNIEIHGMPNGYGHYDPIAFYKDWTDGCIAVSNRTIDEIWASVGADTTVEIMA
ncbi:MAG TPA: L,D-transpeptidase family protein [Stellaceae bacterium]|nr:L,D-transpeptidase family protein [Stellaceae bacterium]